MKDVSTIDEHDTYVILDTGSPHFVKFANDVMNIDVVETGRISETVSPSKKKASMSILWRIREKTAYW